MDLEAVQRVFLRSMLYGRTSLLDIDQYHPSATLILPSPAGSLHDLVLSRDLTSPTSYTAYALFSTGLGLVFLSYSRSPFSPFHIHTKVKIVGALLSAAVSGLWFAKRWYLSREFHKFLLAAVERDDLRDVAGHYKVEVQSRGEDQDSKDHEVEGVCPGPSGFWVAEVDAAGGSGKREREIVGCVGLGVFSP